MRDFSKTHQFSLTLKGGSTSHLGLLPSGKKRKPPYSVLKPLRYKVGGPSEVFASSGAAVFCAGMNPLSLKDLLKGCLLVVFFENPPVLPLFPTFYHNECFPLVLLEAMEHGLPCISTTEGGIPGIVDDGKTGFLVPKHDAVALADKIEMFIRDTDLRHKMGSAGREKFEREFTLEVFEKRMVEILSNNVSVKC